MITNPIPGKTYKVIDGPREHPNGHLYVRVVTPATVAGNEVATFYICEVLESVPEQVALPKKGDTIRVHYSSFQEET